MRSPGERAGRGRGADIPSTVRRGHSESSSSPSRTPAGGGVARGPAYSSGGVGAPPAVASEHPGKKPVTVGASRSTRQRWASPVLVSEVAGASSSRDELAAALLGHPDPRRDDSDARALVGDGERTRTCEKRRGRRQGGGAWSEGGRRAGQELGKGLLDVGHKATLPLRWQSDFDWGSRNRVWCLGPAAVNEDDCAEWSRGPPRYRGRRAGARRGGHRIPGRPREHHDGRPPPRARPAGRHGGRGPFSLFVKVVQVGSARR